MHGFYFNKIITLQNLNVLRATSDDISKSIEAGSIWLLTPLTSGKKSKQRNASLNLNNTV